MRTRAFTLIELLIVVAIIAILAAIAVPNFLEAQVRAKVTRTKADMRTLATALESYAVDNNNKYVFDLDSRGYPWYITDPLSTPVAYISNGALMEDPFRTDASDSSARRFRYLNYPANEGAGWPPSPHPSGAGTFHTRWVGALNAAAITQGLNQFGQWKITSAGPDRTANASFFTAELIYDPTNGTISEGDVIRTQKTGQKE